MKKIAIIGSTGSIGVQTLNVIRRNSDKFKVVALAGGYNAGVFLQQVEEFRPKIATLATEINKDYVAPKGTTFLSGEDCYVNAITDEADLIVVSLVGFKGIIAVLEAIKKGKNIALANKESLVVGGELVMKLAKEKGVKIYPVDSEHSAVWQALNFDFNKDFNKIILTASGGAFRDLSKTQLENVSAYEALKHPNWQMGEKITIDCATLINKAFEVCEARWLYNTSFDKIDVIIHRESIIHSMVEYIDGSIIAQLGYPSMELPIQVALSYPNRIEGGCKRLDLDTLTSFTFGRIDNDRFPCFNLGIEACKKGGVYPAVLNGANEEAVRLFLINRIKFTDIYKCIDGALNKYSGKQECSFENIKEANDFASNYVKQRFGE